MPKVKSLSDTIHFRKGISKIDRDICLEILKLQEHNRRLDLIDLQLDLLQDQMKDMTLTKKALLSDIVAVERKLMKLYGEKLDSQVVAFNREQG